MSALELTHWEEYERLDPFGLERGDYQAAQVAAAAMSPYRKDGADPLDPADLVPDWGGLREEAKRSEGPANGSWEAWQEAREREGEGGL